MEYEIVELEEYSGREARVYSVILRGETSPLFESFVKKFSPIHPKEVSILELMLQEIGEHLGARDHFFKEEADAKFQGKIAKAYFLRIKAKGIGTLRVYCLRFGSDALILFDGGIKPEDCKTWQDAAELKPIVKRALEIASCITIQIDTRQIEWKGNKLTGDLKNYDENEDD